MNRRKYLTALCGVSVGLSGCAGLDTIQSTSVKETTTSSRATTTTRTTTVERTTETTKATTETSEPAEFTVESIDLPDEVTINSEFVPEITVRNTGGLYGDLTAPIYVREEGGEWQEGGEWTFTDVPPGGTVTADADEPWKMHYVETYEYTLGDFQEIASVTGVPKKMSFGEKYTTPGGIKISVSSPDFKARYSRQVGNDEDIVEATDGQIFLFVNASAENTNDQAASLPHYTSWQVLSNNRQYEPSWDGYKDGRYEGGDVQPSVKRDGYLYYELPEDIDQENYSIVWSEQYTNGRATAFWSP